MTRTYRVLLVTACLILAGSMLGLVVCKLCFGLSHENALIGFTAAFSALIALGMLHDHHAHGARFLRRSAAERAALDDQVKHARWGYVVGSIVMLPAVIVMMTYGFERSVATSGAVLIAAITAAGYFLRARKPTV